MKKLVALAMSLTMAFSLVACGNSDASANAGTDTTATSAAATTTEAAPALMPLLPPQLLPRLHSPLPLRSRTFP